MRIKGKYVALVTLEVDVDENEEGMLPFDVIKQNMNILTKALEEILYEEFMSELGTVKVEQQYSDLYRYEVDT